MLYCKGPYLKFSGFLLSLLSTSVFCRGTKVATKDGKNRFTRK